MSTELTDEDREFLLNLVDNPHSDYDDSVNGWPNFTIEDGHLVVTFQDADDNDVMDGRWLLTFVGGSVKQKGEDGE